MKLLENVWLLLILLSVVTLSTMGFSKESLTRVSQLKKAPRRTRWCHTGSLKDREGDAALWACESSDVKQRRRLQKQRDKPKTACDWRARLGTMRHCEPKKEFWVIPRVKCSHWRLVSRGIETGVDHPLWLVLWQSGWSKSTLMIEFYGYAATQKCKCKTEVLYGLGY